MDITKLSTQEMSEYGATHSIKITSADLTETTNNTAQVLNLVSVVNGSTCQFAGYFLKTALQDASDAAFNSTAITIGDGSVANRYLDTAELNVNGTEVTAGFTPNSLASAPHAYVGTDTVDITFNAMAAKALNDIDTGELHVFVSVQDWTKLTIK